MADPALPVLEVSGLRVELGGRAVIDQMGFDLHEGQTLVILGPNGAGKTVLLRTLLGLLRHAGTVKWRKGTRIGYVPQRVPINRELPVTIADFFSLRGANRKQAVRALETVGLTGDGLLKSQLGLLSAGQFQRVLIAWALVGEPDVLLFDEPTAGVDVGGEETVYSLLNRMRGERTLSIVLVTHDLSAVYAQATHVLCMNGKTFCFGEPSKVLDPAMLREIYGRDIAYFKHDHA